MGTLVSLPAMFGGRVPMVPWCRSWHGVVARVASAGGRHGRVASRGGGVAGGLQTRVSGRGAAARGQLLEEGVALLPPLVLAPSLPAAGAGVPLAVSAVTAAPAPAPTAPAAASVLASAFKMVGNWCVKYPII